MTFTTYGVAQIDLGPWNIVVALLIAFFKDDAGHPVFHERQSRQPAHKLFAEPGLLLILLLASSSSII